MNDKRLCSFDQRLLAAFVTKLFCQESLNSVYPLIRDDASSFTIAMPQDTQKSKYVDWMKHLPANEKPTWLGLPNNAEKVLLISEGKCDYATTTFSARQNRFQ
jgi:dynein heavy chain 1, cytosolic